MSSLKIVSRSADETMQLGEKMAAILPVGSTICLLGDLGAGKTTLVKGLAKGLGITETVQSPTFNIMKLYLKGKKPLIHIDAYRLLDHDADIGLDEYIGYEEGITMIEWPQYIAKLIPADAIKITIKNNGDDLRSIEIEASDKLLERLA